MCTDIQVFSPKLGILARHVAMSLHLRLGWLTSVHQMYSLQCAIIYSAKHQDCMRAQDYILVKVPARVLYRI